MFPHSYSTCTIFTLLFTAFSLTDFCNNYAMGFRLKKAIVNFPSRNGKEIYPALLEERNPEEWEEANVVWLNPGVLSNLEEFFENLSSKVSKVNDEEPDQSIEGPNSQLKNTLDDYQLKGYKPSYKIRNYVQSPEPVPLKGTNRHDPSYKWTGLGKRRYDG